LPPGLPLELPLPSASRLVGSAAAASPANGPGDPAGEVFDIVLDIPGRPLEVVAGFEAALAELSWPAFRFPGPELTGFQPSFPGGFLPSPGEPLLRFFCPSAPDRWLGLVVAATVAGINDVRLHIETGNPGPCGERGGVAGLPPGAELLPTLGAPPGVQVLPAGFGGGPGLWSATAVALTEMSVADLAAHYADQLEVAGWARLDGGVAGPLAWSRWTVPGEGDVEGFLTVREGTGPARRVMHVEVMLPGFGPPGPGRGR